MPPMPPTRPRPIGQADRRKLEIIIKEICKEHNHPRTIPVPLPRGTSCSSPLAGFPLRQKVHFARLERVVPGG